jgi:hypothetical protein
MPGGLGDLKPDLVVLKYRITDNALAAIQVADVSVSYPGRPRADTMGTTDSNTDDAAVSTANGAGVDSRTLAGKAKLKTEKYKALVEEIQRRNPGVKVTFVPLVFASVGAVPSFTARNLASLCVNPRTVSSTLNEAVCTILNFAHRMWRARTASALGSSHESGSVRTSSSAAAAHGRSAARGTHRHTGS